MSRKTILALLLFLAPISTADEIDQLPIVDTHIHLYDTGRSQGLPWPPKTDKVLYRPVLPKHFDAIAKDNQITATVIVEASKWVPDNQWVLDLVAHDREKYIGLVGSLEIGTPGFSSDLKQLSQDKRYVGIRLRERPGDEHFFTDEVWRDLKLLAEMEQTLDVLMFNFSLDDVAMIAERLPNLKILINHVAGADIDGKPVDEKWLAGVKRASSYKNVHCKISGLFQQSHRSPSPTAVAFYKPTLDALTTAFGEDRLIYGSNWPVSMKGGKYGDYKKVVFDYYRPKGKTFMEKLLYKNALKFYGLGEITTK